MKASLKDPEFIKRRKAWAPCGHRPVEPAGHKKFVKSEIDKWGKVIKAAGIYAD
jgi:tripartite-type tricarboxylate transporter receptor subunit TctC